MEDEVFLKGIFKYSKYIWSTWFVMKIWIKLTTYSMLKARGQEIEAYNWITDWGPLVMPFVNWIFLPLSRLLLFFYEMTEPFWVSLYFENILPIYLRHLQHLVEPPFYMIQDFSVAILISSFSIFRAIQSIDWGTLVFVVLFLFACGESTSFYCKMKMRKMYRKLKKEIEMERLEIEEEQNLKNEKRRFRPRLRFP